MTAIIVFAHGSTVTEANDGVRAMSAELARKGNFPLVETAFLECAPPDLATSVEHVVAGGASRIIVVPFFLTLGVHLRRDLPSIVRELQGVHSGVRIEVASPLEGHPALVEIMLGRTLEALEGGASAAGQAH